MMTMNLKYFPKNIQSLCEEELTLSMKAHDEIIFGYPKSIF
jgi:hypothetical protein